MLNEMRRRRATRRVKPGDDRPLKRFRWWQMTFRALFYLRLTGDDGRRMVYAVDVRHAGDKSTGVVEAHLYRDGRQHARSRLPAFFPVPGGTVQVRGSAFGLKRCHYVTTNGTEHQLTPDRDSAEGRREHLDRAHPALSRAIGVFSSVVLLISLAVLFCQLIEPISRVEPIARSIGTFTSPVRLPGWGNFTVGLAGTLASMERAMRLRYHWLLDGGAG
ncbi:hypothetical protein GCM10010277_07770 [Streptomyces longisporoflavus]|uniref:hypothetical protein n=1 Tax=Streptomyces longisporoflavus TaxID=28044 RepID=UPI00167CC8E5|nr:hypothetical protein [Streptomyces longisporoflavus]GGV26278.1 hypothetical protein GCM10010277_07770 [Streptomyces longisporoflavus]